MDGKWVYWDAKVTLEQDQQKACIILNGNFLCLSCRSATFASQCAGFVPREWKPAKGLFIDWVGIDWILHDGLNFFAYIHSCGEKYDGVTCIKNVQEYVERTYIERFEICTQTRSRLKTRDFCPVDPDDHFNELIKLNHD